MKAHEPDDGQGEAQMYHRLGTGRAWRRILATAVYFWRRAIAGAANDAVSFDHGFCGFMAAVEQSGHQVTR
jgi:hypothetical protein